MHIDIFSLFPGYFKGPFDESMIKRALDNSIISITLHNLRDFASGKHKQVDDRPYGGGPGMVLMVEPLVKAIKSVRKADSKVIYLSPQGRTLTSVKGKELAENQHLILLCGHYEGIDERVFEYIDEEISIGDYVLTNGCLSAIVLVDVIMRFIPGSLGHRLSVEQDSFENGIFDCPHYTRPEVFNNKKVPEVLLGGHHRLIDEWRDEQSLNKTIKIRPDLLDKYHPRGDVVDKSIEEKELK